MERTHYPTRAERLAAWVNQYGPALRARCRARTRPVPSPDRQPPRTATRIYRDPTPELTERSR